MPAHGFGRSSSTPATGSTGSAGSTGTAGSTGAEGSSPPPAAEGAGQAATAPAARQRVVWRPDQVLVQHDIPGLSDLRDDTSAGRLLVRSFVRAQLGLSLMCLTLALTVTASFPVVAALMPSVTRITVAGVPLTLIVLGFAFYPVFLAVGWFYNRQARQLEARFTDLVEPASRPPDV